MVTSNDPDIWFYIWNTSNFSVKKTYKHLCGQANIHPALKWMWASSCQPKHKIFFWLLLKDRLSTRELLKRKHMVLQSYNCALCNTSTEESLIHLFLRCPFADQCWSLINIQVDHSLDSFESLQSFRTQLQVPFSMKIIIIMCWTIWKARNDLIFRQVSPSLPLAKQNFLDEARLLLLRAKNSYSPNLDLWIANLC